MVTLDKILDISTFDGHDLNKKVVRSYVKKMTLLTQYYTSQTVVYPLAFQAWKYNDLDRISDT